MHGSFVDGAAPLERGDAYLPEDLCADFDLIVANCLYFNGKGSWLYGYASAIKRKGDKIIATYKAYGHFWGLGADFPLDVDAETKLFHAAADADHKVMGYVHWTFPDQQVEDQYPSYLMARRVRPVGRSAVAALESAAGLAVDAARRAADASRDASVDATTARAR